MPKRPSKNGIACEVCGARGVIRMGTGLPKEGMRLCNNHERKQRAAVRLANLREASREAGRKEARGAVWWVSGSAFVASALIGAAVAYAMYGVLW